MSLSLQYAGKGTWHECLSAYRVCRQGDMARVSLSLKCTGKGTWHECLSAYSMPARGHGIRVSQPTVCRQGDMARVSLSLKCTGKGIWHECLSAYRVCWHRERACSDDKPSAGCQPASLQLSRSEGAASYHCHSLLLVMPLSTLRAAPPGPRPLSVCFN